MEWLYPIALRVIAAVALIFFGLGLFNVNWLVRARIIAAMGAGALVVAAFSYSLIRPDDPLGAVSLFTGEISIVHIITLIILGFIAGFVGSVACYPYGRFIGPVAAPAGVATLAMAGGNLKQLLLTNYTFAERNALYGFLRWELLFWLGICAAGYLGSLLTAHLLGQKKAIAGYQPETQNKANHLTNCLVAAVAAAVIVTFTIGIFAQDIRQLDTELGSVVGHPGNRQIAFGVFVSVGIAAFAAKQFLQVHFIPVVLGAAASYIVMLTKIVGSDTLEHMVKTWPIDFFSNSIYAILPIQFAPFAVLGAISGFWMSIYIKHHPEHPE